MFHITIAIGRFFEILLFDIVKSIAGLIALGVIVALGCIGVVVGWRRLGRKTIK